MRSANDRARRIGIQIVLAVAIVGWTGLVVVATLVIGYLWGYGECPNVGPGIYWGTPEPDCAAGYYRRTIGIGALAWITPFVVVFLARSVSQRRAS